MNRKQIFVTSLILSTAIAGSVRLWAAEGSGKQPVYVGEQACGECHQGPKLGRTVEKHLTTKHAEAFAILASPKSARISELSGDTQPPQKSALCLGCHATGAEAEEWEKDPDFHVEEGVTCEKCHGAGSEYMTMEIMRDRERAVANGLILPTLTDCDGCHDPKGSHGAVYLNIDKERLSPAELETMRQAKEATRKQAMADIAHPLPPHEEREHVDLPEIPPPNSGQGAAVTGVEKCMACHQGAEMGHVFSLWKMSDHAEAYATLTTDKAQAIAREQGLKDWPHRSPECLKCHATAFAAPGGAEETYSVFEGVGCEACHGPGSEYAVETIMTDGQAAHGAGLAAVGAATCLNCHADAHGKPFDFESAWAAIQHPKAPEASHEKPVYKTPLNLALSPDGREIYVACESSHSVIVIETATQSKVAEIPVGLYPHDVTFAPDGSRAYVANRIGDSVSVIQTGARKVIGEIAVGDEPHGLLTDRSGKTLYVLNTSEESVSVCDTETLTEIKRLSAGRFPWSLALSPDGETILATNNRPMFAPFREPPYSEVTVIETRRSIVSNRLRLDETNLVQGVAWHPSGRYALATLNRTKNLVPMTRLMQGWTITNGMAVLWADGRVDQVLLDEPHLCFPDPTDVTITPDGRRAYVTSSGSDRIAVVDLNILIAMLESASEYDREHILPNHIGKPTEFILGHIDTGFSPRGLIITQDGATVYVANSIDDTLTVIDAQAMKATGRIDLGGAKEITIARRGERVFHSADITFRRQFSCHSCHPDGHVDGLTYDIEPDGIGFDPVDNRTLRGILDTAPFKWTGKNPSLQRQCGPRLAVFFTRTAPFTPEDLAALDYYICTIPLPPNRHRPLGAELTEAQRRGKAIFERAYTNTGDPIPRNNRCVTCHFPPLYTDRKSHDVGSQMQYDRTGLFDTPHLNNIYESAPYMHNGIAETLEEIWTKYNPYDTHGMTNDLTKDQLNDLIEFIKTL